MSNIRVAVRVRPLLQSEIDDGRSEQWKIRSNSMFLDEKGATFYTFDRIFDKSSTNAQVYSEYCHPVVESVLEGFNGTIFAYGQTSSGKTHTMMGDDKDPGVIPRAVESVFNIIQNMPGREYLLRVSYLEIYKERLHDLLDRSASANLQIRENNDGQPFVSGLSELSVGSAREVLDAMKQGERHRRFGETMLNLRSSRSHTIFSMVIESSRRCDEVDKAVTVSQLNLVDLAGSERSDEAGTTGERLREGIHINTSLSVLSQVIFKLSNGQGGHINYRDSKLTRILQNSLGGNAHTAIVCAVTPSFIDQTLCTLRFASSAKKIRNEPVVNEVVSDTTRLRRYHKELQELQEKIKALEGGSLFVTLQEKNTIIDKLKKQVEQLQEQLVVSSHPFASWQASKELKKQRRETWAAPASIRPSFSTPVCWTSPVAPAELSTIAELSESRSLDNVSPVSAEEPFKAISVGDFERHLRWEECLRLPSGSSTSCADVAQGQVPSYAYLAERVKFLENEMDILAREHKQLQEMTTLERLLCTSSRKVEVPGRPNAVSPLCPQHDLKPLDSCSKMRECTPTGSSRASLPQLQTSTSHRFSCYYSPLFYSPLVTRGDGSSSPTPAQPTVSGSPLLDEPIGCSKSVSSDVSRRPRGSLTRSTSLLSEAMSMCTVNSPLASTQLGIPTDSSTQTAALSNVCGVSVGVTADLTPLTESVSVQSSLELALDPRKFCDKSVSTDCILAKDCGINCHLNMEGLVDCGAQISPQVGTGSSAIDREYFERDASTETNAVSTLSIGTITDLPCRVSFATLVDVCTSTDSQNTQSASAGTMVERCCFERRVSTQTDYVAVSNSTTSPAAATHHFSRDAGTETNAVVLTNCATSPASTSSSPCAAVATIESAPVVCCGTKKTDSASKLLPSVARKTSEKGKVDKVAYNGAAGSSGSIIGSREQTPFVPNKKPNDLYDLFISRALASASWDKPEPVQGPSPATVWKSDPARVTALPTSGWQRSVKSVATSVQADLLTPKEVDRLNQRVQQLEQQIKDNERKHKRKEIQLEAEIRKIRNEDADASVCLPKQAKSHEAGRRELSPADLAAMTPRSREGAKLVHYSRFMDGGGIVERVRAEQMQAELALRNRQLESLKRRFQSVQDAAVREHHCSCRPKSTRNSATSPIRISVLGEENSGFARPAESKSKEAGKARRQRHSIPWNPITHPWQPPIRFLMGINEEN